MSWSSHVRPILWERARQFLMSAGQGFNVRLVSLETCVVFTGAQIQRYRMEIFQVFPHETTMNAGLMVIDKVLL